MSTLGGDWAGALGEAAAAQQFLNGTVAGQAAYQLAELHRLMGSDAEAEAAYRRANALGVQPEPGFSRLRIAQGRPDVAARTLRRLCGEPRPPEDCVELLAARVDAELAGRRHDSGAGDGRGDAEHHRDLDIAPAARAGRLRRRSRPARRRSTRHRPRRASPGPAVLDRAGPPAPLRSGARPRRPVPSGAGRRAVGRPGVRGRPRVLRAAGRRDRTSPALTSWPSARTTPSVHRAA